MDMELLKKEMLEKKIWAVIGATPNVEKFGYKIFKKLKSKGYEVYAVNPNYDTVEGDKCYSDLASLPVKPECVNMVVPPAVSKKFLAEIEKEGIQYVWFQPGTFDEDTIDLAESKGLKIVYYDCVLVALG
ncbi:CoA-binding protein [Geosporobacter ferrireducens]|uniref:CoA-binding protein n=1 Tax=Geosporobacter ferrireducens TaxID=1424294 RepID=A0A1D8GCG7_9FIRM|nr:CoA-binding protein [Geosporobacter ferrireducens]AOT68603.1 CoA-binding protein [Geosporobacter ferrireducens]